MSTRVIRWGLGSCGFVSCLIYVVAGTAFGEPIVLPEVPPPNPDNPVDYQALIRQTLAPNLADEDNAIGDYVKAYELIEPCDGNWGTAHSEPWSKNAEAERWLQRNEAGLDAFKRAARRGAAYFDEAGMRAHTKKLEPRELHNRHLDALFGLRANAWRDWAAGRPETLFENGLLMIRSGQHLRNSPTIMVFASLSSETMGLDLLRHGLDLGDEREAWAERGWPELFAIDDPQLPLTVEIWVARLAAWDAVQRDPSQAEFLPAMNAFFDAYEKRAEAAPWRCKRTMFGAGVPGIPAVPDAAELGVTPQEFEVRRDIHNTAETKRRATHLIFALYAHKAKHGEFPGRLDELDVRTLGQLRIDPYSGEDFVYKKRRGSFKLYSVWLDYEADGGRHGKFGGDLDYVFWPRQPDVLPTSESGQQQSDK